MPINMLNQGTADILLQAWFPVGPAATPRFVVVLDVGQGNCNVVFNDDWRPFIYYDMGGGMSGSHFTYPHPAPTFCVDVNYSLVILSHWDEDHYRSLLQLSNAGLVDQVHVLAPAQDRANVAWRAAIQKSNTAEALEQTLDSDGGTIHKWPDEDWRAAPVVHRSTFSHFRVIKVSGHGTNNSGLALRIENPGVVGQYMLLTGDATFERLTHFGNIEVFRHGVDQACVGLVAGHHGAPVGHPAYIPRPNRAAEYLISYSFGWGNSYGHPNIDAGVNAYEGREWDDDHRMDTGGAEAAAKYAGPRGNVGMLWPGAARGPCYADATNTTTAINGAAVSLIATAAAEIDVYQNVLGTRAEVAVGAAYQAAIEGEIPLVANAMLVPAVQVPARTLAQRMSDMAGPAPTHASLTAAVAVVVATATVAANPNVQDLAKAVVNCVMLAAAICAKEVTGFVESVIDGLLSGAIVPTLPDQAKEAAAQAYGCAAHAATKELVHDGIPTDFASSLNVAAAARSGVNVPSVPDIKNAVAEAVCAAAQARIGQPGGDLSRGPAEAAATAVAAMPAIRDDVRAAIAAAAALTPAIPINPRAFAPPMLTDNENAKLVPRVAAVAAICGTPSATLAEVARAAVAAARVTFAGACGAPQIGCHRHPRVCPHGPCSLSIHNFYGMFPSSMSTFVGTGANGNTGDGGQAAAALLSTPTHVEYDADWNVYVSDPGHHRVRVVDAAGVIRPFAGDGNQGYVGDSDALAANARIRTPAGLAVDSMRNRLFISDSASHCVREVNLSTGIISTIAGDGTQGFAGDRGPASAARLDGPTGLALVASENLLYIADTGNHRIRCVNLTTGRIKTVAGTGVIGNGGDGAPATAATLSGPTAVAIDANGVLYIADTGNHRVRAILYEQIEAFAGDGTQGFAGDGGNADVANLDAPCGLAIDGAGVVYIADRGNRRVRAVTASVIDTFAGTGVNGDTGDGAPAVNATFGTVCAVAVDAANDVYVVDSGNHRVRKVTVSDGNISSFAGDGTQGFAGDDFDAQASNLDTPLAIACLGEDTFIADAGNHRVRRVDGATDIHTHTGDGNNAHAGDADHPASAARLDTPGGLAYDRDDHVLYLADTGNHCVRRIDLRSRNISRVAGSTVQGFAGDDDDALGAELDTPTDVAYDIKGDVLYICDRGNHRIRALAISTGVISTFAGDGNGAFGGDGGAPDAASLHTPVAIAVDGSRNVYVATIGDHRVRKIEYSAAMDTFTVSTLAGTGAQGNTGDGGAANAGQLDTPSGVAVDDAGAVYISCTPRARVRKVQDGVITTLVGTGVAGFAGDGGLPIASQINGPQGLAVDSAGRKLFIADTGNRRVRRAIL